MQTERSHIVRARALETIVPLMMVASCAVFLWGSMHLTAIAMILPAVLIATILAALGVALIAAFRSRDGKIVGEEDDPSFGAVFAGKPWLLILLPLVLTAALELFGALVALTLMVFIGQLIFNHRTPVRSLVIAILVTAPVYLLFAYYLYVRFPAGMLGLG